MGVHLMGVHLMGVHLTGINLTGVHLTGMHLMSVSHRRELTGGGLFDDVWRGKFESAVSVIIPHLSEMRCTPAAANLDPSRHAKI